MLDLALFVGICCMVPLTFCLCREANARYRLDAYWLEREKGKEPRE